MKTKTKLPKLVSTPPLIQTINGALWRKTEDGDFCEAFCDDVADVLKISKDYCVLTLTASDQPTKRFSAAVRVRIIRDPLDTVLYPQWDKGYDGDWFNLYRDFCLPMLKQLGVKVGEPKTIFVTVNYIQ